jgi:hypothetical protein
MGPRKASPTGSRNTAGLDKALGESAQILAPFFETSKIGFGICDMQLRYVAVNSALAASNHLPAEAHLGHTVRDVLGDVASSVEPAFDRALRTQQPVLREISGKPPARAEIVHWIATYFPVKDAAGKVRHLAAIVLEVTDQKRLEESIRSLTLEVVQTETKEQSRVLKQLHTSTLQHHAALKKNLQLLVRPILQVSDRSESLARSAQLLERFPVVSLTSADTTEQIWRRFDEDARVRKDVFARVAETPELQRELLQVLKQHPKIQQALISELAKHLKFRRMLWRIAGNR